MEAKVTSNRDALLAQWKEASELLAKIKLTESELRKQIVEAFSLEAMPGHSGTENVDVGWGYKLKIVHGVNYKLGSPEMVEQQLDQIEASMEGGSIIAERLVKWEPKLSVTEYKLLSPAQKAMIDKVITITDATPTVSLVKPKGA